MLVILHGNWNISLHVRCRFLTVRQHRHTQHLSDHRRSVAPLTAVATAPPPPPLRSGSTHPPQQPKKFIDSGRQHGLTTNPNLLVRSPSPAQLAAVSDYNEKLRVYRLDQAALLARVTAWFEKNIDDENIAEENFEDALR